jgi:hypothetical protein
MKRTSLIPSIALLVLLFIPAIGLAANYTPIVDIGVNPNTNFGDYINTLYALSISVAALLAVIKIVIAGVKWMTTDIAPSKGEAKKDIQGALIGLLVVLCAVLMITIINPNIINVNLTIGTPAITGPGGSGSATLDPSLVDDRGAYKTIDSSDPDQVKAFLDSCDPGAYKVTHASIGETRCYNLPGSAFGAVLVPYTTIDRGQDLCGRRVAETEEKCVSQGGVSSEVDPRVTENANGNVECSDPGHLICYIGGL